jgi:DNA-binding NtrC family response regulator
MTNEPGLRVLVVEDEDLLRWVAKEVLTLSGHRVTEAPDGASALRALRTGEAFDVALLDYRLPDSDGLQLLKEIRRQHPTTAAIMMTAQAEPDLAAEAARLGAYRLIDKPFDIYELETLVREASHSHTVSHVA